MDSLDPHPDSLPIADLGIGQLLERYDDASLNSVEVTSALLERIAALDAPGTEVALASVLALNPTALADAEASDRARSAGAAGPLCGVPLLVKDNVEVLGLPSSAGSTSLLGRPPHRDADLVTRLKNAGAIILGTTNLSEWANLRSSRSASGWSAVRGLTANPWATDRSAGGSSSGSGAALAARLSPGAIGTETDGSITCPASLNGVVGLKPTVGTVPTRGVIPLSASQDSPGPMARSVDDLARLFAVLSGDEAVMTRSTVDPRQLTAAVAASWRTGHTETDQRFDEVILQMATVLGAVTHRDVAVPTDEVGNDELTVLLAETYDDLTAYLTARGGAPATLEAVIAYEREHAATELAFFGHELFEQALTTGGRSGDAYQPARARNLAWATTHCLEPALNGVDVLLAPTYGPAWKQDLHIGEHGVAAPTTCAPAIAGWPIATVPMGLVRGLPVGLGIIGRPGSEATMIAVARAIEATLDLNSDPTYRPKFPAPRRG